MRPVHPEGDRPRSQDTGVEKGTVSRLLRHSDPRMIDRYAKYEVASLEVAAGKVRRLK